jgi:hypothetical protein
MSRNRIVEFYAKTWWLWLLFLLVGVGFSIFLAPFFWFTIPGLILYSLYFATVRTQDE